MRNKNVSTEYTDWPACTCCGQKVRLLLDNETMIRFFHLPHAQRRALQCKNCDQVICCHCIDKDRRCQCKSNAWIALPYLEEQCMHP